MGLSAWRKFRRRRREARVERDVVDGGRVELHPREHSAVPTGFRSVAEVAVGGAVLSRRTVKSREHVRAGGWSARMHAYVKRKSS